MNDYIYHLLTQHLLVHQLLNGFGRERTSLMPTKAYPLNYTLLVVIAMLVISCSGRVSYIESDGALLPIMAKGNKDSNDYIIIAAGGPAGDGIMYHYVFPFFKKLEKEYQIIYYDQRASGNAKGLPLKSTLNLSQHAVDLDKIILSIKNKDDKATIYLMGYSYGGSIVFSYLKNEQLGTKVDGAIMIAGAFDRKLQGQYQQKLTLEFLQQWVDEGFINSFDCLTDGFVCPPDDPGCRQDSVNTLKKVNKRFKKIAKASKFPINPGSIKNLLHYALFAPGNPFRSARNEAKYATYFQEEFDNLILSDTIKIASPVLLMAGLLDTNVPYYDAKNIFNQLDTTIQKNKLLILEKSGHLPMFTEPDLMIDAISRFIQSN